MACELPRQSGLPLSRYSISDLAAEAIKRGIVAEVSGATLWRWLNEDAIKPWQHRSWIFPRDPLFEEKAGRVLDLYQGFWNGKPLGMGDCVLSTDEKTSIQARERLHESAPPRPGQTMRVEFEYERHGALAYLAAWDIRSARIIGRCERKTGIAPFSRLVEQVMAVEPYASARRVFWIMDNGSSHRGEACVRRMVADWPTIVPVHLPVHASWLNQVEIYFSILDRKVLTPSNFRSVLEVEETILRFQSIYQESAKPFEWKFTRKDLSVLMQRLNQQQRLAA